MKTLKLALAGVALAATTPACAAELVTNGGFETGDFTGWTQGGNTGFTGVASGIGNASTFAAFFGPIGSVGTITQVINTVAGTDYSLSFDLRNLGGIPNSFRALVDGVQVYAQSDSTTFPSSYLTLSGFSFTANSASTSLVFEVRQDPSFYYLDNVSVQGLAGAVPEPATWALMILGFGAIGMSMRARSRRQNVRVSFS